MTIETVVENYYYLYGYDILFTLWTVLFFGGTLQLKFVTYSDNILIWTYHKIFKKLKKS